MCSGGDLGELSSQCGVGIANKFITSGSSADSTQIDITRHIKRECQSSLSTQIRSNGIHSKLHVLPHKQLTRRTVLACSRG